MVVMGGSRGIGRATALAFARAGAAVAICARNLDALEATRREIEAEGATAYAAMADLADPAAIARFVPAAAAALGGIYMFLTSGPDKAKPIPIAGLHALLAVSSLVTLLVYVFG